MYIALPESSAHLRRLFSILSQRAHEKRIERTESVPAATCPTTRWLELKDTAPFSTHSTASQDAGILISGNPGSADGLEH